MLLKRKGFDLTKIVDETTINTPDVITGKYQLDYDIIYGDFIVRNKLKRDVKKAQELQADAEKMRAKATKVERRVEKIALENEATRLEKEATELINNNTTYPSLAEPLIVEYRKCSRPRAVKVGESLPYSDTDIHRINIIEQWLQIAKRYITVHLTREISVVNYCVDCNCSLEKTDRGTDLICPSCNMTVSAPIETIVGESATKAKKKNYEIVENIRKIFHRIQGIGDIKIPMDKISACFDEHLASMREMSKPVTKDNMTKAYIIKLLKQYNFEEYYSDMNYIAHKYLGLPLPNYMAYEEAVIDKRTTAFVKIYPQIPKELNSIINGQYLIFKFLHQEKVPVKLEDFKMTNGDEALKEYERIFKEACILLGGTDAGWEFVSHF